MINTITSIIRKVFESDKYDKSRSTLMMPH